MALHTITIQLDSEEDPSTILEWAQSAAIDLAGNTYGTADEDLVSVQTTPDECDSSPR